MKPLHLILLLAVLALLATPASANPVIIDPAGDAVSYIFGLILAICIAVEVAIIWLLCRVFDEFDGERITLVLLGLLNVATFLLVLMPIVRVTHSVVLAEAAVTYVEARGIWKIMNLRGVQVGFRRCAGYSVIVNAISFAIGLMSQ